MESGNCLLVPQDFTYRRGKKRKKGNVKGLICDHADTYPLICCLPVSEEVGDAARLLLPAYRAGVSIL